jgi:electron transfer flavoprotein beta subunit
VRILVGVKRVPVTGGKMMLTPDEQAIETKHFGFTVSPHEECAVEEAVRIVESGGGEVVVLTLGPADAEEQLRDCMAIGADRAILLETQGEEWDAQATATAIVEAVRAEPEPFDLILFGNESADAGGYQVGIRVAYALSLPVVTGLKKIELRDGGVRCERDVGDARDVYKAPLPAVLTVLEGLNRPRYPSVPGRLRAKQKPLARTAVAPPPPQLEKLRLVVPEGLGKQARFSRSDMFVEGTQPRLCLQSATASLARANATKRNRPARPLPLRRGL